jgi:membrane associated rhomboid family serine protease
MNGFAKSDNWVPKLILINVVIYFLQGFFAENTVNMSIPYGLQVFERQMPVLTYYLGLTPALVYGKGYVWQVVSYMFLHGGMFHIFLNMYALLLFGSHIEHLWGSKKFLFYYFFTGIGAGLLIFGINMAAGEPAAYIPTIGASGAVFGLLLAFGVLFPDVEILLFFILPIKAKFLVIMYGGIEFYSLVTMGTSSSVSHVGHLGGLVFGLIFFFIMRRRGIEFKAKKVRARISKEIRNRDAEIAGSDSSRDSILKLLAKLKRDGSEALTDDEYQILKHAVILAEESEEICGPDDFNSEDKDCLSCEDVDACIAREIKRYL